MIIKQIITYALAFILGAISLCAQESSPTIEVNGSSTLSIVPDRITVEIGMEEYFKASSEDSMKVTLHDIESRIREALQNAGVSSADITVSDIGNYADPHASAKFRMAKRLSAVLQSFSQLDKITASLPDLGVTSFTISRLDNSDMDRYNREGLKAALDAARDKAEFIAKNEGLSGLKVWEVEETSPHYPYTNGFSNTAFNAGSGMETLRRIERRYSVKVTYLVDK